MNWWRRNGGWLAGALLLGALAVAVPLRSALQDRAGWVPSYPREAAPGEWVEYEGSRWRVVEAFLAKADAPEVLGLGYRKDAQVLVVQFEVLPGRDATAERLSQCRSRVSDREERHWDADTGLAASRRARRGLGQDCGHGPVRAGREPAEIGRPFRFEKIYRISPGHELEDLSPELRFMQNELEPQGTYLRFPLSSSTD